MEADDIATFVGFKNVELLAVMILRARNAERAMPLVHATRPSLLDAHEPLAVFEPEVRLKNIARDQHVVLLYVVEQDRTHRRFDERAELGAEHIKGLEDFGIILDLHLPVLIGMKVRFDHRMI